MITAANTGIAGNNRYACKRSFCGTSMAAHYEKMGRSFAEKETCYKEEVNEFDAPEYFSEKDIRLYKYIGRWIQKALFTYIAKKNDCKKPLDDKPYQVK